MENNIIKCIIDEETNKICRTCLATDQNLVDLYNFNDFLSTTVKMSLYSLLLYVGFIDMDSDEGMPTEICQTCAEKVLSAYNFKLLCERSTEFLKKSLIVHPQMKIDAEKDPLTPLTTVIIYKPDDVGENFIPENKIIANFNLDSVSDKIHYKPNEILETIHETADVNAIECSDLIQKEYLFQPTKENYSCVICNVTFENSTDFQTHKKAHSAETSHGCHVCGKTFSHVYRLKSHLVTHDNYKAHLCPICGKRFHLSSGLKQHLHYHRGFKPHVCRLCDKRYHRPHLLREHIRCAHSKEGPSYACGVCDKRFTAKSSLRSHAKLHTDKKRHACDACGKSYNRVSNLRNHLRIHDDRPPLRTFSCPFEDCGHVYGTKESLNLHVRYKHTKERPHVCDTCEKSFPTAKGLKEHQSVHTGERPEECILCGSRFVNKQSLKKHMRLHTGERPYPCEHCGERFLSSSRRSEHVQSKHMERLHECHVCHKRYHLKRTLRKHLKIHLGEKDMQTVSVSRLPNNGVVTINSDNKQNVPEPGFEVIV